MTILPATAYHQIADAEARLLTVLARIPMRRLIDLGFIEALVGHCDAATHNRVMRLIESGIGPGEHFNPDRLTDAERGELHALLARKDSQDDRRDV